MPNIGAPEVIIVLVIALIILGPKKLPALGRSLGSGMREFKDSITGGSKHDEDDDDAAEIGAGADEPAREPVAAADKPASEPAPATDKPAGEPTSSASPDAK